MTELHESARGGVVAAHDASSLANERGTDLVGLMTLLLPAAAALAKPPISNFRVGAVARGTTTGNLYYGTNLEFAGESLSFTVHAEQSAVAHAWSHGEEGIDVIATSAAPCGHCRQFLNELATADRLEVVTPAGTTALAALLPESFGPRDLGLPAGLMSPQSHGLTIGTDDALSTAALAAANRSWAPYSGSRAGVALRCDDGFVASGSYAENAAFNPSLPPLQAALSNLNLGGRSFDRIVDAVLVCVDALHTSAARSVLAAVTSAALRVVPARNSAALPPG